MAELANQGWHKLNYNKISCHISCIYGIGIVPYGITKMYYLPLTHLANIFVITFDIFVHTSAKGIIKSTLCIHWINTEFTIFNMMLADMNYPFIGNYFWLFIVFEIWSCNV